MVVLFSNTSGIMRFKKKRRHLFPVSWQIAGHCRKSFPMWLERLPRYTLTIAKLQILSSSLPPLGCAGHLGKLFQPWGRISYGSQTPVSSLHFPVPLIRWSWVLVLSSGMCPEEPHAPTMSKFQRAGVSSPWDLFPYSGDLRELTLWTMQGTDVSADVSLGPGVLSGAEPTARLHWASNTNEKSTLITPSCWHSREIDCRSLAYPIWLIHPPTLASSISHEDLRSSGRPSWDTSLPQQFRSCPSPTTHLTCNTFPRSSSQQGWLPVIHSFHKSFSTIYYVLSGFNDN